MAIVVGIIGTSIGLLLLWISRTKNLALEKYEFDNRTEGGVVEFQDFNASRKHGWRRWRANMIGVIGVLILIVGLFFLIGGIFE